VGKKLKGGYLSLLKLFVSLMLLSETTKDVRNDRRYFCRDAKWGS